MKFLHMPLSIPVFQCNKIRLSLLSLSLFIPSFLVFLGCSTTILKMPEIQPAIVKEYKHIRLYGGYPRMVDTDIHLKKGDTFSILAIGSIDHWPSPHAPLDFKYHDVRPEHGWPFMVRIGKNSFRTPLINRNAVSITSEYSGNLFLGTRDGNVDRHGNPTNPEYYRDNSGFFSVDIIVWTQEDYAQISAFFNKMKAKDPGNKAVLDALNPDNRLAGLGSLPALEQKKMSLKEARQVTVSMSEKAFVPPPRRVDDILSILDQPGLFDPETIARHKARAEKSPPNTGNPAELAQFYLKQGISARGLGRSQQALEYLRKALSYAETKAVKEKPLLAAAIRSHLGDGEAAFGNFNRAIALQKQAIEIRPLTRSYASLIMYYIGTGYLMAAEELKDEGVQFCDKILSNPMTSARGELWATMHKTDMQAAIMKAKGKHAEAELHYRYMLELMAQAQKEKKVFPEAYLNRRLGLAMNLLQQGRFVEAELEARETLKESIGLGGKGSATTGKILTILGSIYGRQGRLNDAEEMTRAAIRALEASGLSHDSTRMGEAMMFLGVVSAARSNFTEAMKHFDDVKQGMVNNQYFYENRYARRPSVIISLIKTGRTQEAMEQISKWYGKYNEYFGEEHYVTARMLGLRGMANAMLENQTQALKDFSDSVPILLEKTGVKSNYIKNLWLKIIVESYLELLTEIHKGKSKKEFGIDSSAEMFKICQGLTDSIVQNALGASGARAAADDPELADLVRKEQDALNQTDSFQAILSDAIAAPRDQQNPDALKSLRTAIASLNSARAVLLDEIKRRFPKYADFTTPQPVTFSGVQKHLRPGEALITIFPSADQTYVWAIPYKGEVQFAIEPIGKENLQKIVVHLRKALDSDPGNFGDIPAFDFSRAHSLYRQLLQPVEKGWKDASDVIVVAHGPLAQLPFSVLPTTPVLPGPEKYELFTRYRMIPWLIRKVSITRQPSVSSFITLRNLPAGDPDRKSFAGFGDPIFNMTQLALAEGKKYGRSKGLEKGEGGLHVRGLRITEKGDLDRANIPSLKLSHLNRLPDTSEEIKSIAGALGADLSRDIFLGKKASERQVKIMPLSDRRIIAFASHALVPGDIDGLDQPAIALSAPSVTGDNEDGLLTMEEVLKLKLNADWVVLSACNTGAAEGAGAEAVSGLGQAFFYAGTRAILVSMWPVETTSAKELTTGLFKFQKEDKTLSRARALQKSMLDLIDNKVLRDKGTGKVIASYAHPLFWAPFIVVGEGGSNKTGNDHQ